MKKIYLLATVALIAAMGMLVACHENVISEIDDNTTESKLVSVNCKIDNIAGVNPDLYADCQLMTIAEQKPVNIQDLKINVNQNECIQTIMLGGDNDETFLMARSPIKNGEQVELSVRSTTIALVMMHPLLSPLKADSYDEMTQFITSSAHFQDLYDEIEKLIKEKKDILNENNADMIVALGNVIEDLFKYASEDNFEGSYGVDLEPINIENVATRGNYDNPKIYPLSASIYGDKLILQNTNLTPSYYGTMKSPSGTERPIVIPACGDWGWWEWITQSTMRYGSEVDFTFVNEGEYRFHLSRVNEPATIDFYARLTCCVLSTIGLPTSGNQAAASFVANRCTSLLGTLGSLDSHPIPTILSVVSGAVCDYLAMEASKDLITKGWWENVRNIGTRVGRVLFIYNIIKGSSNIIDRIAYAIAAPKELDFCLCYYNGQISTCTTAKLFKAGGDEQTGYANQKLMLPLKAYVQTLGDDGLYHESSNYHKVKFKVISGGGYVTDELVAADEGNVAQTYWYLGDCTEEQIVEAVVIDMITGNEISEEPVYYTATLSKAEVTVRLDWSQHSGNTDIDLHVVDPYGERICYYHMNSASGGYLDRDDTHGPGPEHIHWSNAPAGTYKIYVHYYPNEDEDKSVVNYKVSVTADGITYRPATGFISYDQMVPVGQFTIGENQTRSTLSVPDIDNIDEVKKDIVKHLKRR